MSNRKYMVYARCTGGEYITKRSCRVPGGSYRWVKSREAATRLTRNAAIQIASLYGGRLVLA